MPASRIISVSGEGEREVLYSTAILGGAVFAATFVTYPSVI